MTGPAIRSAARRSAASSGKRCKQLPGRLEEALAKQGFAEREGKLQLRRDRRRAEARAQGRARLTLRYPPRLWPPASSRVARGSWARTCATSCCAAAIASSASTTSRRDRSPTSQHIRTPEFRFVHADIIEPVLRRRAGRLRLPLRQPGVADRLPAAAAAHAEGRLARHAPHARAGQGAPRALPARLDVRGLRRSEGPSAARVLLGPREPDRPARRLRRGQALRRGADDGLPPPAGRRHGDRADLQHLRPADAPARRARDPDVPAPGAAGPADHGVRRRLADALVLLRVATWSTASSGSRSPATTSRSTSATRTSSRCSSSRTP